MPPVRADAFLQPFSSARSQPRERPPNAARRV